MFLAFIANYILRGEGEMKSSMFAMGFSAVLNIILDPLFIFVFGWGVEGAAWATVLARAVGCIIAFSYIFSKKSTINLSLFDFKFDFNIIKEIFVIGIPSSLSQLINSLSLFAITGIVAGFGSGALAAFGIIFRSEGLMFMPVLGVMTAVITIVGQNFGAGKVRRSRKIALNASLIVAAFSMFIGIFYFLFSEQLALLFNSDPVVVHYVSLYFLINFWTYPFMAVMMIIIASFLGAGKPFPPLMINLVRMFVITIPFAYFFSKNFGLIGVWWCFPIAILFSFFLSLVWFLVVDFHHSK